MNKVSPGLILLSIALFLAALMGGNFPTDAVALDPSSLWAGVLSGTPPLFCHGLIALFAGGALVYTLATKRVIQVPFQQTLFICVVFAGAILLSTALSTYRWPAMYTSLQWLTYIIAMGAAAALTGRHQGAFVLLGSLVAGCAVVSLLGIQEYAGVRAIDPNWRIFSYWMNPNALAGMLLLGFFAALGLATTLKRIPALLSGLAGFVIGIALVLTQSKGGFLALGVGLIVVVALTLGWNWKSPGRFKPLIPIAAVVIAFIGFIGILRAMPVKTANGASGAVLGRVASAGDQSGQSAGFRKLLWKGSFELMKRNPVGYGGGSYQFVSTKPGLSTATPVTHQSFLQVGVEFGILALLAFLALGLIWFRDMFRGAMKLTEEQNLLRAGVVAAVVASVAHSFIDSDLSYYGNGLAFFVLLGIGLQLCADGVTPEAIPKAPRTIGLVVASVCPVLLLWFGFQEAQQAGVRGALAQQNFQLALDEVEALQGSAGGDGETWYLTGLLSRQPNDREAAFKTACQLTPWPKYFRALARSQEELKNATGAMMSLSQALDVDPNNMLALKQMMALQQSQGNIDQAKQIAQRLVAVEQSPYYTVRAIPEDVPTETFDARLFLANQEPDPAKQIELLKPAVEGYRRFIFMTLPKILQNALPGASRETAVQTVGSDAENVSSAYTKAAQNTKNADSIADAQKFKDEVDQAMARLAGDQG